MITVMFHLSVVVAVGVVPLGGGVGCLLLLPLVVVVFVLALFCGGCCLSSFCWVDMSFFPFLVVVVVVLVPFGGCCP